MGFFIHLPNRFHLLIKCMTILIMSITLVTPWTTQKIRTWSQKIWAVNIYVNKTVYTDINPHRKRTPLPTYLLTYLPTYYYLPDFATTNITSLLTVLSEVLTLRMKSWPSSTIKLFTRKWDCHYEIWVLWNKIPLNYEWILRKLPLLKISFYRLHFCSWFDD